MELTKEQQHVHEQVMTWLHKKQDPYLAVAGYAGTGKTTVMGAIAADITRKKPEMSIAYVAPTGKASLVLENKLSDYGALNGKSFTGTIHSLIYTLAKTERGRPKEWRRKDDVECELIVVDESSMITQQVFDDLLAFDKPLLFIGDAGQLPPVNDRLFFPLQDTPLRLTEVHRQALGNPIIRLATDVRAGKALPFGAWGGKAAKLDSRSVVATEATSKFLKEVGSPDTVVLCGTNKTRVTLNRRTRRVQGLDMQGLLPVPGERLVCLKNDKMTGLRNGQLVYVSQSYGDSKDSCFTVGVKDVPSSLVAYTKALHCTNPRDLYEDLTGVKKMLKESNQEEPLFFDYGYTLSVHKAQGSEWERVLLVDERNGYMTDEDYTRWLYTGVTRARDKLLILSSRIR